MTDCNIKHVLLLSDITMKTCHLHKGGKLQHNHDSSLTPLLKT